MTYKFKSGREMLDTIQNGTDLYSPSLNVYVFLYNDSGSICCYYIDEFEAKELERKSRESGEYWGAFLGWGGHICDDPSYEYYNPSQTNNLDFCEDTYTYPWIRTIDVL